MDGRQMMLIETCLTIAARRPPPQLKVPYLLSLSASADGHLTCDAASKEPETTIYYHTFGPVFAALQSDAPKHAAGVKP